MKQARSRRERAGGWTEGKAEGMTRFIRIENGAWKAGHSGFGPEVAAQAFRLGTNSIYHSCLRYIEQTRKNRK